MNSPTGAKTMSVLREKIIPVAATLAATMAIVGTSVAWINGPGSIRREYPDSPFLKVGENYPHLITLAEAPDSKNEAAHSKYFEKRVEVWRYLSRDGAVSRATPEEREAVSSVLDNKYVKGQLLAARIVERNPNSVPGLYALALAVEEGDSNLPGALFIARKARHLLEERGRANPGDADAREWYIRVLEIEFDVVEGLDRTQEALRIVELLAQVYHDLPRFKVWPLFKQKRFAEAEAEIASMERSGNWPERTLNDRLVLNDVRHRRRETYAFGKAALPKDLASAVHWSNLGEAALGDFRLEEAEKAYLTAADLRQNYWGTAYVPLASLRIQRGALPSALEALHRAKEQRSRREPSTIQFDQAEFDRQIALLLLATGQMEESERSRGVATKSRIARDTTAMCRMTAC